VAELFQTAIVEKRNVLNELRSNNMTLQELRFFSIYLSKIDPYDLSTRCVRFPIEDFQRIMGFGRLNLGQIRASTDSLLCKLVHVPDEDGYGMRTFQLFKECHLFKANDGKWYMEIDAHDKALPLMFEFKNRYFTYELWNALRLKSPNQVRMYEILKQYEKLGKRELTVTELRELLGIDPNEYTLWQNFKVRVLDSCQQALKDTTDICFTYERGKSGRGGKWLSVVFHIQKNNDYIDQLTLEEFINMQPDPEEKEETEEIEGQMVLDLQEDQVSETDEDAMAARYGSEQLANLAEACNYEFGKAEMELIFQVLTRIHIPKDQATDSLEWGRIFYLQTKYAALNVEDSKKQKRGAPPIINRFKYFLRMLEEDTFQPASYKG
jgi:plasmid replication initiation protein